MLVTDQMNYALELDHVPGRIISIVPSQTELLYSLGLGKEVVGITKFCVHPEDGFRTKTRVGGTKNLNIDRIRDLVPDLIIGNKEENEKDQILELKKEFPVWMSDIQSLEDALIMIREVGRITGKLKESEVLISRIASEFRILSSDNSASRKTAAYLIWKDPFMVSGSETFTGELMGFCGLVNVFKGRYPQVTEKELKDAAPELVFLSSEPYPFSDKHIDEIRKILPASKLILTDGEMFSWYGSRLELFPRYFQQLKLKFQNI